MIVVDLSLKLGPHHRGAAQTEVDIGQVVPNCSGQATASAPGIFPHPPSHIPARWQCSGKPEFNRQAFRGLRALVQTAPRGNCRTRSSNDIRRHNRLILHDLQITADLLRGQGGDGKG
jgi:hypothetical protein